jgi:signal transduction histidine kinase
MWLVLVLFLGSLATVLYSTFQTFLLPQREYEVRARLREASQRMARAAEGAIGASQHAGNDGAEALNARLRTISRGVLADYPGVEGGFYLDATLDRFAGYAFPSGQDGPQPPPRGDEPPPKEAPFILVQARHSLSASADDVQFDVRTVGPSRVAIWTEAVGGGRPARLAAWTMFRLVSPESQETQLRRYQIATGLALGGIALAVVLTLNLIRTLARERVNQERLHDELRRAEHLAALGKLLAGVAHEVRNPLAGIRSTVQLWERLPETARTQGSIQTVMQEVDRLNEIVSRLLFFSRADRSERRPASVNELLSETLRLVEAQAANQSVALERELEPNLPVVLGSASALRQVFLNLATNALQAMPTGGRLRCSSRLLPRQRVVEVRFADTGPGISPEEREHLFEPFFTTRADGTGLGLAICREILTQHGGQIEMVEAEGPGASFRVTIPARD